MDTREEQTNLSQGYFNTVEGKGFFRGVAVCGVATFLYFWATSIRGNHYISQPSKLEIRQEQVLGTEKPEIYFEYRGVRYFSHVDGKEISDLVK